MGAESASICETVHALSMEIEPSRIVYDSPCKIRRNLEQAMKQGVSISLDNECELELVEELLNTSCQGSTSAFFLRINPLIGEGHLAYKSRFGLPILPHTKKDVAELFAKHSWLSGVHIHVGGQGTLEVQGTLGHFVQGVKICMDFVHQLEKQGIDIKTVNIGGGLYSSYKTPEEPAEFTFQAYKDALFEDVPELFSGKYQIMTAFGRSLLLKAGTTLTKIEYVKQWIEDISPIAICHVGANQFFTDVYLPQKRRHRMSLANELGEIKSGHTKKVDVAGNVCFQVSQNYYKFTILLFR